MKDFEKFVEFFWNNYEDSRYIAQRIKTQFDQIFLELNHRPSEILLLGYKNALAIDYAANGISFDTDLSLDKKYDTVLALDEYFTYSDSEQSQRQSVDRVLGKLSRGGIMLTSIRDYRNNPVHKKFLGDTSYVTVDDTVHVVVEKNTPSAADRQSWQQTNYVINTVDHSTEAYTAGHRRTLYFKQLAKYCNDAGCNQFGILRENFWKNPIRKNMEHIAWTRYNQ